MSAPLRTDRVTDRLPAGIFGRPPHDRESIVYWRGLDRHELTVEKCSVCATIRWPARALCNRCRSFDAEWVALSGNGTVVSWATTRHAFGPWRAVPYTTVMVRLAEQDDVMIPATCVSDPAELSVGSAARAVYIDTTELPPIGARCADGGPEPVTVLAWRCGES